MPCKYVLVSPAMTHTLLEGHAQTLMDSNNKELGDPRLDCVRGLYEVESFECKAADGWGEFEFRTVGLPPRQVWRGVAHVAWGQIEGEVPAALYDVAPDGVTAALISAIAEIKRLGGDAGVFVSALPPPMFRLRWNTSTPFSLRG
jgi:hypothetical protein